MNAQIATMNLQRILQNGEDATTEFKSVDFHSDSLAKEIVAFANMSGGRILVGVSDDGRVHGVSDKKTEERVIHICRNNIVPPLIPEIVSLKEEGRKILCLNIPKGHFKPYKVRSSNKYYIRVGSVSIEPTNEELIRLFQNGAQLHFEASCLPGTGLADVDLMKFRQYCSEYRKIEWEEDVDWASLLYNFQIVDENRQLTVCGALFFGKHLSRWLPQAGIDLHCFEGDDRTADLVDHKSLADDLPTLLGAAEQFVRFNSRTRADFSQDQTRRNDRHDYEPFVVRELVANAFMHRDWSIFGQKIRLDLFADRMEVFSPGGIPNTLNLQRALSGISYYRNPIIAQMLKDYGLAEKAGRGLSKIVKIHAQQNRRPPDFDVTNTYFKVTIPRRNAEP